MQEYIVHTFNKTWNKCASAIRSYNSYFYLKALQKLAVELQRSKHLILEEDQMLQKIYGAAQTPEERIVRLRDIKQREILRFTLLGYFVNVESTVTEGQLDVKINLIA